MRGRNWKRVQPTSLRNAMELTKEYAKDKHNLSVQRIAERMGEADHWTLYKWMENGRIPAVLIPAYEAACGVDFITRWLASRSGKLLIEIPTGRKVSPTEMHELQEILNSTVGSLLSFYGGNKTGEEALADLTTALQNLGWHKGNVEQHINPQLELGECNE